MNPGRWKQIKQLFEETLSQTEADRSAYLDAASQGDPELKSEVVSLLDSHTRSGKFLEPPEGSAHALASGSHADPYIGRLFGPYRIEKLIGHGGMGAVYEAMRVDGEFQKRVAIKLVRHAAISQELIERFHQERQTLARLDHPNIARLIDGGTTTDLDGQGVPYLILEYVDGVPLDEYCDQKRLTLAERLSIFRTVCDAVQYAHQNLIVHRDLKPGNILVTPTGVPKLLDFGIAKLIAADQQVEPSNMTRVGLRFITVEYASPEQIKNEPITTASDVYSLGVLLYKLLTGRSPYTFKNRLPHEMTRTVCEQEPLKPSTNPQRVPLLPSTHSIEASALRGVTPEKLRRLLSGDLDNILLKALQKDPHRRYVSVEQLSEDLRRHLEGLPVRAHQDSLGYRTTRFVKRHALGVSATMLVFLAVVGGVIGILWQANKAQKEAAKAEQINHFLQEMLASADPAKSGKDVTVAQTLDVAVQRVDLELWDQPEIASSVLNTIGETYIALGLYDKALAQLERSLAVSQAAFGNESATTVQAIHSLAYVAQLQSDFVRADSLYRLAISTYREFHSTPDRLLVSMLGDWGTLLRDRRDLENSSRVLKEAVEMCKTVIGENTKEYATSLSNLGPVLQDLHETAAAESVYRKALEIGIRVNGEEHLDVSYTQNNLAFVLMEKGDMQGAEKLLQQSLSIRRKTLGADHPEVAVGQINLAGLLLRRNELNDVENLSRDAVRILRKSVNPDNVKLSSALLVLGKVVTRKGEAKEAEQYLREGLKIREKIFPPQHYAVGGAAELLARCLVQQRRYAEAEPMLLGVYQVLQTAPEQNRTYLLSVVGALKELYASWGKGSKAETYDVLLRQMNTQSE